MTLNEIYNYLIQWWWQAAGFAFVLATINNAVEIRRRRKRKIN